MRALLRTPAVSAVAILSLALAIGANSAAFSVLNALLLRTLAVPHPSELVAVSVYDPAAPDSSDTRPPAGVYPAIAAESSLFSGTLAWQGDYPIVNLEAGGLRYASTLAAVGGDYFATLGIRPLLGRFFGAAEHAPVAVIDYRCWKYRYGRAPDIIGKSIRVDGVSRAIIGVTPESFTGLELETAPEVTVPIDFVPPMHAAIVARLRSGVTLATARARIDALWTALPTADHTLHLRVERFSTGFSFLRDRQVPAFQLLLGLAAAVLVIACLNLANLMLARAAARRQETAIRIALGASRGRLIRALLSEALTLSAAGGALGLLFAAYAGHWLVSLLWTGIVPTAIDPTPDLRVVAFTAAISLASGALFGLAPARGLFDGPARVIRGAGRPSSVLVAAQIGLSIVLASGALLLVRELRQLRAADLGYRRDHLLMVRLFPTSRDPIANRAVYYRDLAAEVAALPGVEAVSYSALGPVTLAEARRRIGDIDVVTDGAAPGFFRQMGIRQIAGRDFTWTDDEHAPPVAIVSNSLAARLSPARVLTLDGKRLTVVGVVADASLWNPRTRTPLTVFTPVMQDPRANSFWMEVRTAGQPAQLAAPVRRVLDRMGRHTVLSAQTLDARLDGILARERMTAGLAAFLGCLAVLLAAVGIYGLTATAVARRTREIGIRMAIGAAPAAVTRMVVADVLKLVAAGLLFGVPAALWSSKLLPVAFDAPSLVTAAAVVTIAAIAAAWRPARRAARTDPAKLFR